jgi:hypothetical protein
MNAMDTPTVGAPRRRLLLGHWPSLLGLVAAASQILSGMDRDSVAITIAVAASCYLAGGALGRPWIAWATIPVGTLVVALSEIAGIPWWVGLTTFAALLVLTGLLRRTPARILTAQGLAMLGYGGMAVAAVLVSPRVGLTLAGVALATHALWDYRHWRRNDVVPRSLAEFCIVLDIPFGVTAIVLAVTH